MGISSNQRLMVPIQAREACADSDTGNSSPWSKLPVVIDRSLRTDIPGQLSEIAIP